MVIQLESEGEEPSDAPARRSERARFVLVKNHVREVRTSEDTQPDQADKHTPDRRQQTNKRLRKSSSDAAGAAEETRDLEQLRQVYFKCKRLLQTIECKYGDRLHLHGEDSGSRADGDVCSCRTNKKIKFDESGSGVRVECGGRCRVQVETERSDGGLPDDVAALSALLREPALDASTRRAATDKLKVVRATRADEFRYHRRALQERMRSRPDDELGFVGTNLSSLPGYLYSYNKS